MRSKNWSYSAGTKPNTVTVFEREHGGVLYARAWNPSARQGKGNWIRTSLGHKDKQKAKRYAIEQAAKLQKGEAEIVEGSVTLARVFALYQQHKTPYKSKGQQKADVTRFEMWTRVLGANIDPHNITPEQWSVFIRGRSSGAIDPRGYVVPDDQRQPVRARTVEADCQWLRFVFNWAVQWRLSSGGYLMRSNPIRGNAFDVPTEKNPKRPLATVDYFEAIRKAAEGHTMELRPRGKPSKDMKKVPSYLPELLDIVEGTARRISAICSLRYSDLHLAKTKNAPYGAIVWPGETDKEGRTWKAPITPRVRAAIDRILKARPGVGSGYLFPAPGDSSKPLTKRLATSWFTEAEALAGIEHVKGRGWHSLRRKWGTERKHLPDVDVMAGGGWKSLEALKRSYQSADEASVLAVVLCGNELREAK